MITDSMVNTTPVDRQILYQALVQHDGDSLCGDWPVEQRRELTKALDRLRMELSTEMKTPIRCWRHPTGA